GRRGAVGADDERWGRADRPRDLAGLTARVTEDERELGHRIPGDLGPEEHAVGEARRAPGRADALGSHLERRMRLLVGPESHATGRHPNVAALESHLVARPQAF